MPDERLWLGCLITTGISYEFHKYMWDCNTWATVCILLFIPKCDWRQVTALKKNWTRWTVTVNLDVINVTDFKKSMYFIFSGIFKTRSMNLELWNCEYALEISKVVHKNNQIIEINFISSSKQPVNKVQLIFMVPMIRILWFFLCWVK